MFFVFDIGATTSRFGLSADGKRLARTLMFPTPGRFSDGLLIFRNVKAQWKLNKKVKAVIGGVPGPLDTKHASIAAAPHLPDWNGKPLKRELEKLFKTRSFLENDTALVGLGEAVSGAGKRRGIVAYVTISTGVNGVRIVDGRIDRAVRGFEIGHQILTIERLGRVRTWEDFVSGAALRRLYDQLPEEIDDSAVWQEVERYIAFGLNNVIVHWSPDIVVLGGGIMRGKHISLGRIQRHLKKVLKIFSAIPPIVHASLGDQGGLFGALTYLQQFGARG